MTEDRRFIEFIRISDKCQFIVDTHSRETFEEVLRYSRNSEGAKYLGSTFEFLYLSPFPKEIDVVGVVISSVKTPHVPTQEVSTPETVNIEVISPWLWILPGTIIAALGWLALATMIS